MYGLTPGPGLSSRCLGPRLTAFRAKRVLIAAASASVVFVMLSQLAVAAQPARGPRTGFGAGSEGQHSDGSLFRDCVVLGLKPIPVKLTLLLAGDSAIHTPTLKVSWSGKPLPRWCGGLHTVIAVRARVPFPKTGHTLEFGPEYSSRWSVFWLGRTHVHNAERRYPGPTVTFNPGCVEEPQAWLRYEVLGRGGRSLARLVRPAPVSNEICQG
jgi:hypothetical protein